MTSGTTIRLTTVIRKEHVRSTRTCGRRSLVEEVTHTLRFVVRMARRRGRGLDTSAFTCTGRRAAWVIRDKEREPTDDALRLPVRWAAPRTRLERATRVVVGGPDNGARDRGCCAQGGARRLARRGVLHRADRRHGQRPMHGRMLLAGPADYGPHPTEAPSRILPKRRR